MVERYDGSYPKECIETFCREFKIRKTDFDILCEPFINSSIFLSDKNGFKRDLDGSLVLKNKFINRQVSK